MNEEQKQEMALMVKNEVEEQLKGFGDVLTPNQILIDRLLRILDGRDIKLGQTRGTRLGTSNTDKLGFFGETPVSQQAYPTTAEGIADMLAVLGLCGTGSFTGGQTIYAGYIDGSDGSTIILPAGWSATRDGTGAYTVTHNLALGENGYVVVASMRDITAGYAVVEDISTNDFEIEVYDDAGAANDEDFTFIMVV